MASLRQSQFLLDSGVNYRTKRRLLDVGFAAVYQLVEVRLMGRATDPEIFGEAQQRQLIIITKLRDILNAICWSIPWDCPSPATSLPPTCVRPRRLPTSR
jgi:hypothetical protein